MTLTRITNAKAVRSAVRKIESAFKSEGIPHETVVGFPGGSEEVTVWWSEMAGIWLCPPSEWGWLENRYWFGYGTIRPGDQSSLPIAVEINFPKEGINRRVKGLLASDGGERVLICHNGQLGGRLGAGTGNAFAQYWGRDTVAVVDGDGRETEAFAVAELDSSRVISQIAEFVRACAAFKSGAIEFDSLENAASFTGADDEFEGTKDVPETKSYTASCDHGIVRNRLAALLKDAGLQVGRDQSRDLIIGAPQSPEAEFEIKSACDPQHVYTAVGQLLVHSVRTPTKSRVAVLPGPIPSATVRELKALGLHLVQYRWTKTHVHFDGLEALYPNVTTSAPINPPL